MTSRYSSKTEKEKEAFEQEWSDFIKFQKNNGWRTPHPKSKDKVERKWARYLAKQNQQRHLMKELHGEV